MQISSLSTSAAFLVQITRLLIQHVQVVRVSHNICLNQFSSWIGTAKAPYQAAPQFLINSQWPLQLSLDSLPASTVISLYITCWSTAVKCFFQWGCLQTCDGCPLPAGWSSQPWPSLPTSAVIAPPLCDCGLSVFPFRTSWLGSSPHPLQMYHAHSYICRLLKDFYRHTFDL